MIAFKATEFEQALPEIREEVRRRANDAEAEGVEPELVMIPAAEYARLRRATIIDLRTAPPELFEEMARQLEAELDRRIAAGETE